jgi:hypothetical protein
LKQQVHLACRHFRASTGVATLCRSVNRWSRVRAAPVAPPAATLRRPSFKIDSVDSPFIHRFGDGSVENVGHLRVELVTSHVPGVAPSWFHRSDSRAIADDISDDNPDDSRTPNNPDDNPKTALSCLVTHFARSWLSGVQGSSLLSPPSTSQVGVQAEAYARPATA